MKIIRIGGNKKMTFSINNIKYNENKKRENIIANIKIRNFTGTTRVTSPKCSPKERYENNIIINIKK